MKKLRLIECACGRSQSIARENESGGVTIEEAVDIGWKHTMTLGGADQWTCPFCAGDTRKLRRIFHARSG